MAEMATIPVLFYLEKYRFDATDFQTKADSRAKTVHAEFVDDSNPTFIALTKTCGV